MDAASASAWLEWWKQINTILNLEPREEPGSVIVSLGGVKAKPRVGSGEVLTEEALPPEVAQLKEERENARREKNWKRSDELRERISALGWQVRDTRDGPKLTRGARSA